MLGFVGRLLGTEKGVDDILDKDRGLLVRAGGWVDGLSHTEQEKAEDKREIREWGLRQLEALAPFKVVQRILAFTIIGVWAIVAFNCLAAIWVEAFWPEVKIKEAMLSFAFSDYVLWPTAGVVALYFSGGVVESFRSKIALRGSSSS